MCGRRSAYGADKGQGGKYLILPPGNDGNIPPGYLPLKSDTNMGYALLRSNVGSDRGPNEDIGVVESDA